MVISESKHDIPKRYQPVNTSETNTVVLSKYFCLYFLFYIRSYLTTILLLLLRSLIMFEGTE